MLICPQCKSENPQVNNFCQGCGVSLTHYTCSTCSAEVDFAAENCSQCQTPSGAYFLGIVSLAENPEQIAALAQTAASEDEGRWDGEVPITQMNFGGVETGDDLAIDPWATVEEQTEPEETPLRSGDLSGDSALAVLEPPAKTIAAPLTPTQTTHLDPQSRYRLVNPMPIQLTELHQLVKLKTIDTQPFLQSPLEALMEQEPVTTGSTQIDRQPESYRQLALWTQQGIPRIAQAYMALQSVIPNTIPQIRDAWEREGQIVVVVEDRTEWLPLIDNWGDGTLSPSQTVYWLDYTLKLWMALEPWQMRQSLLDFSNLVIDEDYTLCLQSLQPESRDRQVSLVDLGRLWQELFDLSGQTPAPQVAEAIGNITNGKITKTDDVRLLLQEIARQLRPETTADISAEATPTQDFHDAPTVVLPKNLVAIDDGACTHTGKKRAHNEDCFGIITKIDRRQGMDGRSVAARGLYILCDGMGGHDGGEVASAMTVESLRQYFVAHWKETLPDEKMIREGIIAANQAVYDLNQSNSSSGNGRMGTTLVMLLLQDRTIAVAHVGDSRCYAVTSSQGLIQLTLDHEVGQQEILRGVDPEVAYGRPNSYQLTQAIGPRDRNFIAPDVSFFELQEDTIILLASDGLTDNQLLEVNWLTNVAPLMSNHADLQQGVERLVDFANDYNGHDNITAIGVRIRLG
jgi:protein phosphatase